MSGFHNPLAAWVGRDCDPAGAQRFAGKIYRDTGLVVFVPETLPAHQRKQVLAIADQTYGRRSGR